MGLSKKSNFPLDRAPQKSVNASRPALRLATHDSGSGWLAMPFLRDSFIHCSTPIYPGAPTRHAGPHRAVQRVTQGHRTAEEDQENRSKRAEARWTRPGG